MAFERKYTDEQYAEAESLIAQGATISEASRTVGVPYQSLYRKLRKPDPTPGGKTRQPRKLSKPTATDEQLVGLFTKIAVAPAIPAGMWLRCDFCAAHFVNTGPDAAVKLVELSRDHPALRSMMESLWRYADEVAWAGILATWLGVPIAHHLAPDWIYRWVQLPLGMPPRNVEATNGHGSHPPVNGAPMPDNPLANLDLESLMGMARMMGIDVQLPVMPDQPVPSAEDADATESAESADATESASAAADEAAPAASDQDASE